MPPKYVRTMREEIYYEYAKLMSRSAYAGKLDYGFITNRFKDLRDGHMTIYGTGKEFQAEHRSPTNVFSFRQNSRSGNGSSHSAKSGRHVQR